MTFQIFIRCATLKIHNLICYYKSDFLCVQSRSIYPNGDYYIGEWKFGIKTGNGKLFKTDDIKETGESKKNVNDTKRK